MKTHKLICHEKHPMDIWGGTFPRWFFCHTYISCWTHKLIQNPCVPSLPAQWNLSTRVKNIKHSLDKIVCAFNFPTKLTFKDLTLSYLHPSAIFLKISYRLAIFKTNCLTLRVPITSVLTWCQNELPVQLVEQNNWTWNQELTAQWLSRSHAVYSNYFD